jgi:hypothetical protein
MSCIIDVVNASIMLCDLIKFSYISPTNQDKMIANELNNYWRSQNKKSTYITQHGNIKIEGNKVYVYIDSEPPYSWTNNWILVKKLSYIERLNNIWSFTDLDIATSTKYRKDKREPSIYYL